MAFNAGTAYVTVAPSFRGFQTSVAHGVQQPLAAAGTNAGEQSGKRFSSGFSKHIAALGASLGGLFAISKGVDFFKGAIDEARDAQKVGAQTAAVLKSTRGEAGLTAVQIGNLAGKISSKTAIDDEAIQSGENLLLTFTNIRNEAGKGNDIFSQATSIMTDLSVATGTSMKGASIQLGKALNDPVKGVSALSRVGVSFTDTQKAQIQAMVDSGNTMGAQKIILRELNKEFAGSAAAQATPAEKAEVAWGNFKETIGTAVLPILDKLLTWFSDDIVPALSGFIVNMQTGQGVAGRFADVIVGVGKAFLGTVTFLTEHKTLAAALAITYGIVTAALVAWKIQQALSLVILKAHTVGTVENAVVTKTVAAATKTWTAVQWLLNAALSANPIGLVIGLLVALGVGLVIAYKKSETFRKIVDGALGKVKDAAQFLWDKIKDFFGWLSDGFSWIGRAAGKMATTFSNAWDNVQDSTKLAVLWIVDKVTWLAEKILDAMVAAFGWAPKIGPKLKAARDEVAGFRKDVNAEMDRIQDENVKVTVHGYASSFGNAVVGGPKTSQDAAKRDGVILRAAGGAIPFMDGAKRGRDSVLALLTPGEHVFTDKEVKLAGGHHGIEALRAGIRAGIFRKAGDIGWDPGRRSREGVAAFAIGGPVFGASTSLPPTGPIEAMRNALARSMAQSMQKKLKEEARKALAGPVLPGGGRLTPAQIARGQAFARSQVGKPYIWGGVGPAGYDCSGFVSAVLNAALGVGPYFRRGSTGTMPWPGSRPGTGSFTYGYFQGNPGHTAGNIGGLPFESTNGSTRVGAAARSVMSFPHIYHYDDGGLLPPGMAMTYNGTGRGEHKAVLTDDQWRSMQYLAENRNRLGGVNFNAPVVVRDESALANRILSDQRKAAAMAQVGA